MIKVMLTMTIIPSIFIIKIKINLLIHYYYLSLGSNPLSLSLTELPNSSTSPEFKANPSKHDDDEEDDNDSNDTAEDDNDIDDTDGDAPPQLHPAWLSSKFLN